MGTLGWVFLAVSFLVFVMVANNSWPWVWSKITGNPVGGSGGSQQSGGGGIGNVGPTIPVPGQPNTGNTPLPSIEVNGCQPTLDGKTNAITGAFLDQSRPICRIGPLAG